MKDAKDTKKPLFSPAPTSFLTLSRFRQDQAQRAVSGPSASVQGADRGSPAPRERKPPDSLRAAGNAIADNHDSGSRIPESKEPEKSEIAIDNERSIIDEGDELQITSTNIRKNLISKNKRLMKSVQDKRKSTKEKRIPDQNYRSIQKTASLSVAEWNLINKHAMSVGGFSKLVRKMFFDELKKEKRPHPESTDY